MSEKLKFMREVKLGVNVDHVATLRQNRGTVYPDPVHAALMAEEAGADGITVHLREDRRHIQEFDVRRMSEMICTRLNLEMAVTPWMIDFALEIKPTYCCLVPEKRQELTTEGGLDVVGQYKEVQEACERLGQAGILVSLFIDPEKKQIEAASAIGAPVIEIHTGAYAEAKNFIDQKFELARIREAADLANHLGLVTNAGHGLHYHNVQELVSMGYFYELNIGHAIVARALFVGMHQAVREMKSLLRV